MSQYNAKVALLSGIVDYAGTFAPASLPLPEALKKAATFRKTGKHPWLLSKVALPFPEIKKLTPTELYNAGSDGAPWAYTALAAPFLDTNGNELLRQVEWDLREIKRWNNRWVSSSVRQSILSYELRLSPEATHKSKMTLVHEFLAPALDRFVDLGAGTVIPFFEISFDGNWRDGLKSTAEAMAAWVHEMEEVDLVPGLKIRTGGTYLPSSEQLTAVIETIVSLRLKFKATQGLHKPISKDKEWGFVNLFATLAFAQTLGLEKFNREEIKKCLECSEAKEFVFSGDVLKWDKFEIKAEEIETARREHGATFGSCSIDEPDQFLSEEFA